MLEHHLFLPQNLASSENQRQTTWSFSSVPSPRGQRPAMFPTCLQCSTPTVVTRTQHISRSLGTCAFQCTRYQSRLGLIPVLADPVQPAANYLAATSKRRFPRSLDPATPLLDCFHRVPLHRIQSFKVPPATKPRISRPWRQQLVASDINQLLTLTSA